MSKDLSLEMADAMSEQLAACWRGCNAGAALYTSCERKAKVDRKKSKMRILTMGERCASEKNCV